MLLSTLLGLAAGVWADEKVVSHDKHPNTRMTVNDPGCLGVDSVQQYSGYVNTTGGAHMFYWAFESRSDPNNDPTVLWLNGGPGCSSLQAIFFEHGPSTLNADLSMNYNPYSWNNNANIIYLDQPVSVGFSDGSELVNNTAEGALDVTVFLDFFFQQFPHLARKDDFHIAGESYGGRYVPLYAEALMGNPDRSVNVKSIIVGNGVLDPYAYQASYQPMLCGKGGYPQKLSDDKCKSMEDGLPACMDAITKCIKTGNCHDTNKCNAEGGAGMSGLNPYDIRQDNCPKSRAGLCYPGMDPMIDFYNKPEVKTALGADTQVNWKVCGGTGDLGNRFSESSDTWQYTPANMTKLIDQGVQVLIYAGDKDIICNWVGQKMWTSNLEWSGKEQFNQALSNMDNDYGKWSSMFEPLGRKAHHDKLTLLRVYDAGHMVPHDQPRAASKMFNQWLKGDYGFENDALFY